MTDGQFSEFGYPMPGSLPKGGSPMSVDSSKPQNACKAAFEDLPYEVLDNICAQLAPLDAARRDIANFSLASKKCAKAASRRRLERIVITITTTSELQDFAKELEYTLASSERLACVRHMKLKDLSPHISRSRTQHGPRGRQTIEDEDSEADDEDDHSLCRLPRIKPLLRPSNASDGIAMFLRFPHYRPTPTEQVREISSRCQPLCTLLGKLCTLSDVVWDCDFTIPVCLLDTLRLSNPRARLHIHRFFLREKPFLTVEFADGSAGGNEKALISTPSLDTIVWRREGGSGGVNKEVAMWCMLQGASPNLKHVVLEWGGSPRPWPAEGTMPLKPTKEKAKLLTLSLGPVKALDVRNWEAFADFAELRTLRLRVPLGDEAVEALDSVFKTCPRMRLRVLEVRHADHVVAQRPGVTVPPILTHVSPLEHLEFTGPVDVYHEIPTALQLHGPTLRVLELRPIFRNRSNSCLVNDLREVAEIVKLCPFVERLDLTVARTHGDLREMQIYNLLARMPHLRHLKLRLDCSMQTEEPKTEQSITGDGDVKLSWDDYQSGLINAAIDEALATSIFSLFGPQLQYLRIKPQGHGEFGRRWHNEQAMEVLDWIGRDWVVRRGADGQGEISRGGCVREGHAGGGPWRGEKLLRADFGREPGFDDEAREDLREIWTGIWPGKGGDRTEQWASMSLAGFKQ